MFVRTYLVEGEHARGGEEPYNGEAPSMQEDYCCRGVYSGIQIVRGFEPGELPAQLNWCPGKQQAAAATGVGTTSMASNQIGGGTIVVFYPRTGHVKTREHTAYIHQLQEVFLRPLTSRSSRLH